MRAGPFGERRPRDRQDPAGQSSRTTAPPSTTGSVSWAASHETFGRYPSSTIVLVMSQRRFGLSETA